MAYRKKSSFKRKGTKRRTYSRKSVKTSKKAVKKIVKAEIRRAAEDKFIFTTVQLGNLVNNGAVAVDTGILAVSPGPNTSLQVASGTGRVNRIGNKITCKYLGVKMNFFPPRYSAVNSPVPCPIVLDVYCFYDKQNPTGILGSTPTSPTPAQNGDFFYQQGASSGTQGFSYDLRDHYKVVNTSRYHICWKKTFKIGWESAVAAGTDANAEYFANNDFKAWVPANFNLTKDYVKSLSFPDATTIYPRQHGLWLLFVPMRADGSPTLIPAEVEGTYNARIYFKFEDM